MIDYNNIDEIIKDVVNSDNISYDNLTKALKITYKAWKIQQIREETISIRRKYYNKLVCCERCGSATLDIELHHKVSVELGGDNSADNIELLCHKCHNKANKETGVYIKAARCRELKSSILNENSITKVLEIAKELDYKYFMIFYIVLNTGLNINDVVKLRHKDLLEICKNSRITTYNNAIINLDENFINNIYKYIDTNNLDVLAFISRKHCVLSRQQLYRVVNKCGTDIGSLYKTFCYIYITKYKDIKTINKVMGFASDAELYNYLGISEIDNIIQH